MSLRTPAVALNGQEKIVTAYTVPEVQKALSKIDENAVIFIDVDDTLITPKSKFFHASSPYRFLIDDLKRNREKYRNFEEILSHWRLQRKTILVSEDWPDFINTLKTVYPVYALTKMETGSIGAIPSMEKWRYEELKGKGISFTPLFHGVSEVTLVSEPSKPYPASFYKGIFITGSFNKSDIIRAFLKTERPSQIVLIDDRPEYLQDAIEECNRQSIPFLGILFKGTELILGEPDHDIAEFQKQTLLEHAKWLEDEEAEQALRRFKEDFLI
ncbi:MAG: hypothetical protein BGO67_12695 [Alphaproteobacteria bacterium 41-28]|nr:MAG: hypothetical protein BGO67_12695 [Alphaproteobacteria bacterium 41-28]